MSEENTTPPKALAAPETDVTPLTLTMVSNVLTASRETPRKRMIQPIHKSEHAAVHRMFNALQPGTYITPHRHMHPPKHETIMVVSGSLMYVEFTDDGTLASHTLLQPGTEIFGIDVPPHIYHTFIPLKPDTLIFEVKDGPYEIVSDKDVPDWAPQEDSPDVEQYLLAMLKDLAERANEAAEKIKAEAAEATGEN